MGLAEVSGKQDNGPEISFMNPPQQQTGRSRKNSRVTRSQINDFQPHALNFGPHPEDEQLLVDSSPKQQQQQQRNRYHVCRHCNRSFSSGRALGGHIRIHGTSFSGGKAAEIAPNNGDDAAAVAVTAVDSSNNSSCRLLLLDGKPDQDDQDYDNGRSMDDAHANATATGDADADADADAETSSAQADKELGNGHGDDDGGGGDETNNKNKARMKMVSLYTLRNNPRRSCKFLDPEFRLDHGVVASNNSNKRSSHESNQNPSSATGNIHGNSNLGCSESGSEQRRPAHGPVVGKWSVTRNRSGRKLKRKGSTRAAADDRDTANLLVMLAAKVQGNGNVNGGMESTEESVMKLFPSIESQGSIKGLSDDCDDEDDDDKEGQQDFKPSKRPRSSSNINNNGSCDYQGECGNDGIGDYGDAAAAVAGRGGMGMQEMNMVDKNRGSRSHSHRCNTCNKVFTSHQALGGHRASHRKVKGCFAQDEAEETEDEEEEEEEEDDDEEEEEEEEDEDEEEENGNDDGDAEADREDDAAAECQASSHANAYISKNRSKAKAKAKRACEDEADIALSHLTSEAAATAAAPEQEPLSKKPHTSSSNSYNNNNNNVAVAAAPPHQCSICLRVFPSGQALGGHKRCHWVADKGNHVNLTDSSVISSVVGGDRRSSRDRASASASAAAADELIDLNQPPPMDEEYELPRFDHGSGRSANHRVKVLQSSSRRLD